MSGPSGQLLGLLGPLLNARSVGAGNCPTVSAQQVDQFIASGLGAMLHSQVRAGNLATDDASAQLLAGCDLAALAIYKKTCRSLGFCLKLLNDIGVTPILLKGAWLCERNYPRPHWRTLGDVDILVPAEQLDDCYRLLTDQGFRNGSGMPDSAWDDHHHVAPLFHPELKIWVELHRQLFRNTSVFADLPAFSNPAVFASVQQQNLYGAEVLGIKRSLNIRYLCCHWYWSLMEGIKSNQARGMIDVALLLKGADDSMAAAPADAAGFATVVMLRALGKAGLIPDLAAVAIEPDTRALPQSRFAPQLAVTIIDRRVSSLKNSNNQFVSQLLGDWLGVLVEAKSAWKAATGILRSTWSRLFGLLAHKLSRAESSD